MARATKKRRRLTRARRPGRNLGLEAAVLWMIVVSTWGYTAWAVYSTVVRKVHVHLYVPLLLVDLVLPVLAVWMTIEWRRLVRSASRPKIQLPSGRAKKPSA